MHYLFQLTICIYISSSDALDTNQEVKKPLTGKCNSFQGKQKFTVDWLLKALVQTPTNFRGFV